jgi:transcriptional regulator with XRE-family HTH domain
MINHICQKVNIKSIKRPILLIKIVFKEVSLMVVLRLKEYREKLKLSQRDVAKMMEITQAYYWYWEKGKNFPNANQILKLCEIFRCTPNDLFGVHGVFEVAMGELDQG